MILDSHTVKDLEIFGSEAGATSLFEFCDLTRTDGGSKVLRRRMEAPWSTEDHILATQSSVSFILAHRSAFAIQPSAYTSGRVERYLDGVMRIVTQVDVVGFSLGALACWTAGDRHYIRIMTGVRFTCEMIQALRRFVRQAEVACPAGELVPLLQEMRMLLNRSKMAGVPDRKTKGGFWRILRLDQLFRLHERSAIARLVELTYELDALVAMADVTRRNDFVMPRIRRGSPQVHAEGLVHPLVQNAVANPVALDEQRRVLFLTGPNMAGKTTYLRAFATALYFAHLGMGVPARSFHFVPVQRLFSSISLSDNLQSGISYFRAEALRVKAIAQAIVAGHRVVALLDEPFKGTNVKDALDASLAILERFARSENCLFMFSSHLIELGEQLVATRLIDYRYFEAEEAEGRLRFDYLLRRGVSGQRLGMRVLREEGIFELLDTDHATSSCRPDPN